MTYARSSGAGSAAEARDEVVVEVGPSFWRNIGKWSVALLLFGVLASLLVSLLLFQVTAEGSSKRTLRRAVAALTEIDPLLDRNYEDLRTQASAAAPGETVTLRDYPIDVPLTKSEVLNSTRQQLRDLLLDRSATLMYAHGTSVWRANHVSGKDVGAFSVAGLTDNGLGFLRSRNHDVLGVVTFVLAAVCVVLGATLVLLSRGFGRVASVGAVVLAASAPVLLAGIGARFYMRIVSGSETEYLQKELLAIGQGLAWIPIRDGLAFTALGAALLAIGWGCAIWADRRAAGTGAARQ